MLSNRLGTVNGFYRGFKPVIAYIMLCYIML